MRVGIVGLGYVGLPLALLISRKGHEVIGIDVNLNKINLLRQRISPFSDEKITQELKTSSFRVSDDFSELKDASVIVLCVPTPVDESYHPDLTLLEDACKGIARHLSKGQLVILESTVNPGVCENIVLPLLERISQLKGGKDFYLSHCPERVNPGDKKWNVENIPRVIGSLDETGLKKAIDFYASIISAEIRPLGSLKEAEAVKIVENAFRDINIAFVNELAQSFSRLGIDILNVIEGAATKPFAFMPHYPGCGVGGHCIPVDPYYLIDYAKKNEFDHDFLSLARRINNSMPRYAAQLAIDGLNEKRIAVNGARVAVLGLAYKPEIDDDRESPSYKIIKYLKEHGAEVIAYDPFLPKKSSAQSLDEAVHHAQAVILVTAHHLFRDLTAEFFLENGVKVVIDGRNCLPKDQFNGTGIIYKGIGRQI